VRHTSETRGKQCGFSSSSLSGNISSVGNFDSRETCSQAISVLQQSLATTMEVACVQGRGPVLTGKAGGLSELLVKKKT
jgi:hypothetical protein